MEREEVFLTGEIIEHPICVFTNINEGGSVMGFVYKFRTTQLVNYEYELVDIWIKSVYEIKKWDILRKGQKLKLSVLQKEKSKYSPDNMVLKCNIVSRSQN